MAPLGEAPSLTQDPRPLPILTVARCSALCFVSVISHSGAFASTVPRGPENLWAGLAGEAMALGLRRSGLNVTHQQGVCPRSPEASGSSCL